MLPPEEIDLDSVHPSLVTQTVLKAVFVGSGYRLSLLDATEEVFYSFERGGFGKRAAANSGQHLWHPIVVGYGDHQLHQSHLAIAGYRGQVLLVRLFFCRSSQERYSLPDVQ